MCDCQLIENEFASVSLSLDRSANDARLKITDNRTGHQAFYDALLLEALAWAPPEALRRLLDPSLHQWSDEQDGRAGVAGERRTGRAAAAVPGNPE